MNATHGYMMQRIRTSAQRFSTDPVRQTPHPGESARLASHRGVGEARHEGVAGERSAGIPSAPSFFPDGARAGAGDTLGRAGEELVGFARPALREGPAATDAPQSDRDEPRPSDTVDTPLVSADPHPHALANLEMTRASSPGAGELSHGPAPVPGFAAHQTMATAPVPAGDPGSLQRGELSLRTGDGRYVGYFQKVYERVRSRWEFPPRLARELQQGLVVVSFTILNDGRVVGIAVRKSSGFREFDENVVRAVERAAPLPPVPATLGARELHVSAPFEYLNPLVR
jgi:TonB family protein